MATMVKPTKKDSPAIHRGANRDNKPAEAYAKPHSALGKKGYDWKDNGYEGDNHNSGNDLAVSIDAIRSKPYAEPKTSGVEMRGAGAATKGRMSRGPMA